MGNGKVFGIGLALVTTKDQCVISIILMQNLHHWIVLATGKNIKSIPAVTRTAVLQSHLPSMLTSSLINCGNKVWPGIVTTE